MRDFIVHIDDGRSEPLKLLVEVTGKRRTAKLANTGTATALWVAAINLALVPLQHARGYWPTSPSDPEPTPASVCLSPI